MHHTPKRVRTAQSGACTYCVKRKDRCYIGVKGIPCTTCDRLNLVCDGRSNVQKASRTQAKKRVPSLTYCAEGLFASQLQETERKLNPRFVISSPGVHTTEPLDNYLSIVNQLLGPRPDIESRSIHIPDYVTALPDRLDAADLRYLEAKGALCLPTARFRTELLKSYIVWVHSQVPVLDLEPFLRAIAENNGVTTISLLLFHAVMFAGAAFVDISHIRQEGYTSRKAARDILFQRAKALLELHCEDDRLATVQALLLLVHWHDIQNTDKDPSHLVGTCLSLAISIGLHRSPENSFMAPRKRQVWKRTWWSLYNHARLTSEDLLTMMTIEGEHHASNAPEVEMIDIGDFQFEIVAPAVRAVAGDCDVLESLEHQTIQALIFVEKTKLCRLSQFSSFSNRLTNLIVAPNSPQTRVCPKVWDLFATRKLEELQDWYRELPAAVQHTFPVSLNPTTWERSIYLQRTWLKLLYLGTSYAVFLEEIREFKDPLVYPFVVELLGVLENYLIEITDIFEEVYSLGLCTLVPGPAVALLVLALTYHRRLLEKDSGTTPRSALKLHQCWNIMHRLHDTSVVANDIVALLTDTTHTDLWDKLASEFLVF